MQLGDTGALSVPNIFAYVEGNGEHICPDLYRRVGFEMGVSRRGLPYVPGFMLKADLCGRPRRSLDWSLDIRDRRANRRWDEGSGIRLEIEKQTLAN
jgi:hypothetical protein